MAFYKAKMNKNKKKNCSEKLGEKNIHMKRK